MHAQNAHSRLSGSRLTTAHVTRHPTGMRKLLLPFRNMEVNGMYTHSNAHWFPGIHMLHMHQHQIPGNFLSSHTAWEWGWNCPLCEQQVVHNVDSLPSSLFLGYKALTSTPLVPYDTVSPPPPPIQGYSAQYSHWWFRDTITVVMAVVWPVQFWPVLAMVQSSIKWPR